MEKKIWRPEASAYLQEPTELAARLSGKNISRIVSDGLRQTVGAELEQIVEENSNIDEETKKTVLMWLRKLGRIKP